MDRRQFLKSAVVLTAPLLPSAPGASLAGGAERRALILHTVAVQRRQGRIPEPGEALDLELASFDMGHYDIDVLSRRQPLLRIRSSLVGGFMDRDEPVRGFVTDVLPDGTWRLDVVLDRVVAVGERLPLVEPVRAKSGLTAQLTAPGGEGAQAVSGDWLPVRPLRWHAYVPERFVDVERRTVTWRPANSEPAESLVMRVRRGGRLVKLARRAIYNPTPWSDHDPVVPVVMLHDRDFAYILPGIELDFQRLLLRGERIEARLVRPCSDRDVPGGIAVDISLVA